MSSRRVWIVICSSLYGTQSFRVESVGEPQRELHKATLVVL